MLNSLQKEVDAILIWNAGRPDPNFFYVTDYTSGLFEGSIAILHRDDELDVFTSPLEEELARRADANVRVLNSRDDAELASALNDSLSNASSVGVNEDALSHSAYTKLCRLLKDKSITDVSSAFARARWVKDPDERERIAKAAAITSGALERVPQLVKEGMTEKALQAEIEYWFVRAGADGPAFSSIVAFGENSALPHYFSGDRTLAAGDTILCDVGARYKLYCADMTRTFFFRRANEYQREMYAKVKEAQDAAFSLLKDGAGSASVHKAAEDIIDNSSFRGGFIHGLGHSLGIEVHDGYGMGKKTKEKLVAGAVVTVEPGIYVPGKGGVRIEDDVAITQDSFEFLTKAERELMVI